MTLLRVAVLLALTALQLHSIGKVDGVTVKGDCSTDASSCDNGLMCESGDSLCHALIGSTCTASSTDECVTGAAACPANAPLECQCPANFVPKSDNTKCCHTACKAVTESCAAATDTCNSGLVCVSDVCKTLIGGDCTAGSSDECVPGAMTCPAAGGTLKCACPSTHVAKSDNSGCLAKIGTACTTTSPCVDGADTCAADSGTCACPTDYVAKSDNTKCLKKLDVACTSDAECLDNGQCGDNGSGVCKCSANYVGSSEKTKCNKQNGANGVTCSILLLFVLVTSLLV